MKLHPSVIYQEQREAAMEILAKQCRNEGKAELECVDLIQYTFNVERNLAELTAFRYYRKS